MAAPRNRSGNIAHCWWIMSLTYRVQAGSRCGSIQPIIRNGRGPMICTSMFRSSKYLTCPSAASRNCSTVTPAGPARSWPTGLGMGVLEPIMSTRKELAPNGTDTWPWTSRTRALWYTAIPFPCRLVPAGESHSRTCPPRGSVAGDIVQDGRREVFHGPGGDYPVEGFRGSRPELIPGQGAQDTGVAGGDPGEYPAVKFLVDHEVAEPARGDDRDPGRGVPALDRAAHRPAEVVAPGGGRHVRRVVGVQEQRDDRRVLRKSQPVPREGERVPQATAGGLLREHGEVEAIPRQLLGDVCAERAVHGMA